MTSPSPSPLLVVDQLTKAFPIRTGLLGRATGAVQAVSNVSFTINQGETVGLVGESGCGKSTLGRCILQLIQPTSGQVTLDGVELTGLKPAPLRAMRRHMQMIFQNPYSSLNPRMRVGDALEEPLIIHGMGNSTQRQQRVQDLLAQVGLPADAVSRYPHEFSGGQRQRIGIARALSLNPKLIVADEPVSALDVSVQAQILNLLDELKRQHGLTYLFVAHNLDVVRYLCDRVMVMYLGQVVEQGSVEQVYRRPLHPYTQALLSAAPVADPVRSRALKAHRLLLHGDLPNPANPPTGCRFHTRCPHVTELCKQHTPALQALPSHPLGPQVACHHAQAIGKQLSASGWFDILASEHATDSSPDVLPKVG
jgi:oligopeptide transport system ATP-binding protein